MYVHSMNESWINDNIYFIYILLILSEILVNNFCFFMLYPNLRIQCSQYKFKLMRIYEKLRNINLIFLFLALKSCIWMYMTPLYFPHMYYNFASDEVCVNQGMGLRSFIFVCKSTLENMFVILITLYYLHKWLLRVEWRLMGMRRNNGDI